MINTFLLRIMFIVTLQFQPIDTDSYQRSPDLQTRFEEVIAIYKTQSRPNVEVLQGTLDLCNGSMVFFLQQWSMCNYYFQTSMPKDDAVFAILAMDALLSDMQSQLGNIVLGKAEVAEAFFPLLDSQDVGFRKKLVQWLSQSEWIGEPSDKRIEELSFAHHEQILRSQLTVRGSLPKGLVTYLFGMHPGKALETLISADGENLGRLSSLLDLARKIPDRKYNRRQELSLDADWSMDKIYAELDQLSRNSQWWVQLVVAECLKQIPEFATSSVESRLSQSEDDMVRAAVYELRLRKERR